MDGSGPLTDSVDEIIEHYGVRGMHWGVRRKSGPTAVTVTERPGRKVRAKGGSGQAASEDAVKVATYRQQARKSSTDSLSTKQLQELVTRMNLEQQYSTLTTKQNEKKMVNKGAKFATSILAGVLKEQVVSIAKDALGKQVKKQMDGLLKTALGGK